MPFSLNIMIVSVPETNVPSCWVPFFRMSVSAFVTAEIANNNNAPNDADLRRGFVMLSPSITPFRTRRVTLNAGRQALVNTQFHMVANASGADNPGK